MLKALLLAGASVLAFSATSAEAVTFVGGSVVSWTVPQTGVYDIVAAGGQGGATFVSHGETAVYYGVGGQGAVLGGDIRLSAGTTLHVVAGQAGSPGDFYSGGGGGGSFVYESLSKPLLIAGGGGGVSGDSPAAQGGPGQTGTAGQNGLDGGGLGGVNGSGGQAAFGGGGGGWLGVGGSDYSNPGFPQYGIYPTIGSQGGYGPPSFAGGSGGYYVSGFGEGGDGGLGGGGGGAELGFGVGGGGGGGFSGGGAGGGGGGGGGGSYIAPDFSHTTAEAGANSGNGYVTITEVSSAAPEPATWSMMVTGFGFLGYVLRRRVLRRA